MKKFIAVILSSTMIFTSGMSVYANNIDITNALKIQANKENFVKDKSDMILSHMINNLIVNGKQLTLNESKLRYQGKEFIPIRDLAELLGLKLDYIAEHKIVLLDNGKIQLPIDSNKAIVNGQIVPIDKENSKICTLILNDKAYIPINFLTDTLGYTIEEGKDYSPEETILSKEEAIEIYKKISEQAQNIKNSTIDTIGKINIDMTDGTDSLNMVMDLTTTTMMNIAENVEMYSKQVNTIELLGEKEIVNQEMFYKDGKIYVKQNTADINEFKYKMDLNLDEALKMSNTANLQQFLNEDLILDGTVKELENNNKLYTFKLNMSKFMKLAEQIAKDMDLGLGDFKDFDSYFVKKTDLEVIVDNNNKPISYNTNIQIQVSTEGITFNINALFDMKYKNIGNTIVTNINEDLNQYQYIKDSETEETTA